MFKCKREAEKGRIKKSENEGQTRAEGRCSETALRMQEETHWQRTMRKSGEIDQIRSRNELRHCLAVRRQVDWE